MAGRRGVVGLRGKTADFLLGPNIEAGITNPSWRFALVSKLPFVPKSTRQDLKDVLKWSKQTGYKPIFVHADKFKGVGYSTTAVTIRHERIHQAHMANPSHSFFNNELSRSKEMDPRLVAAYQSRYRGSPSAAKYMASERLAYGNEGSRSFFSRLRSAGLPDPRRAHIAPGRKAVIEGLSHSGVAATLRRVLTSFGSPWQGLGAEPGQRDDSQFGLTPGQTFDLADTGLEVTRLFQGNYGPVGWPVATFAALDVAVSAGTAKPGKSAGKVAGAVAAQSTAVASWYLGGPIGRMTGRAVGAFAGGSVAGPWGATVGGYIGAKLGFAAAAIAGPILIDPFVRKVGVPVNKMVQAFNPTVNFGGFQDSQPAYTMRQRALQELQGSLLNAHLYLGREAQLMHQ